MKYIYIFCLFLFVSCDSNYGIEQQDTSIIVEGWIEDGEYPIVMLTQSLPVSENYQNIKDLEKYLIRWAKVSVSNGTDTVVLTGKYDSGYFPPYIYTTGKMRGRANQTYWLEVSYKNYHASAKTTIPHPVSIDSFNVKKSDNSETLCYIKVFFKDNPKEKNYYQLFIRVGTHSKQYIASYLGSIDDAILTEKSEVNVYQGHRFQQKEFNPYFSIHDTVSIKFAHIDMQSFWFWDDYTKALALSSNMFFSTTDNIRSNIVGGSGYWCGYGTVTKHMILSNRVGGK